VTVHHSRPQQNWRLVPKIPIVNTAFMDLGRTACDSCFKQRRDTQRQCTLDIRNRRIARDRCRFGPLSSFAWYRQEAPRSEPRASGAATDTTSERLSSLQLCCGYSGLPCGPSGADEARTGDLHHDEQWISLDSCELRNVHRTQRYVDGAMDSDRSHLAWTADRLRQGHRAVAARTWLQVAWWHRHSVA
jgi:hypothetical protein